MAPARTLWVVVKTMPKPALLAMGLVLVLLLGVVDFLTGAELSTSILYLFPIVLATWLTGRRGGILISLASALVWWVADVESRVLYSHPAIPYWNAVVRLVIFLLTTILFSELRVAQERRRNLENIFFHDVLNVIGSIRGAAELLLEHDPADKRELCGLILEAADQTIDEINAQKIMSEMENHELRTEFTPLNARSLLEQVIERYRHHKTCRQRLVELAPGSEDVLFVSDPALLSRVLGNMLKNALEAVKPGEKVTAGCAAARGGVEFWVRNPGIIPAEVRPDIFRRAASTKGQGRGLGTYSIRVLSDHLKGTVSFSSSQGEGTTFRAWYPIEPK
jgi:signal transduction histidine kinase